MSKILLALTIILAINSCEVKRIMVEDIHTNETFTVPLMKEDFPYEILPDTVVVAVDDYYQQAWIFSAYHGYIPSTHTHVFTRNDSIHTITTEFKVCKVWKNNIF